MKRMGYVLAVVFVVCGLAAPEVKAEACKGMWLMDKCVGDQDYGSSGSSGGSGGYGNMGSVQGSDSSSGSTNRGPFYVRNRCLSGWKDLAGLCCNPYRTAEECQRAGVSCRKLDASEWQSIQEKTNEKLSHAKSAPACSGD